MNKEPSISRAPEMCELCSIRPHTYTCPRCNMRYCSSNCYKSDMHIECSESFYQQCVIDELKLRENDPEDKKKMLDILKRLHEAELEDDILEEEEDEEEDGELLDSDDDENVPDLQRRLENINLDNPDEVWSILTDTEKQEFEAMVKSGEAEKLLPKWSPWWMQSRRKKLVKDLDLEGDKSDHINEGPQLIEVPVFAALSKASPNVCYNLHNVLYAYTYIALHYNGDYLNCAKEATSTFFSICENMKNNTVFNDSESAAESVVQCILNTKWLPYDKETIKTLEESVMCILEGPEYGNSVYISAALSELHRMLTTVKNDLSTKPHNQNTAVQTFSRKFNQRDVCELTFKKREVNLCLKKLEYYLSWVKKYGMDVSTGLTNK